MKPVQLKMTAFGPYKDTETIDFRELNGRRLFVISGKTGAGKTTIFDGICFALYGLASGEDRTETKALRSQFADDSVQTEVEFIFAIGTRTFRVMRQIPYKKKGNKSETPARCELYEEKDGQFIPAADRQMVTEVNSRIEQLLGFTHAQFSQIMMLPQGEFRKFLTSDTANKELIMRKIFKTEIYQKAVEQLKLKKDHAQAAYLNEKQAGDALFHQITAKLPERSSALFAELAAEYPNSRSVMEGLLEEQAHYKQQADEHGAQYESIYGKHAEAQKLLYAAYTVNEQFEKLAEKERELRQLQEQRPVMEQLQEQLAQAERAARLEDAEQQLRSSKAEAAKKKQDFEHAVSSLEKAEQLLKEAEIHYRGLQDGTERSALKQEIIQLEGVLPTVSKLAQQKQSIDVLKKKYAGLEQTAETKKQALAESNEQLKKSAEDMYRLEQSLENYEELLENQQQLSLLVKQLDAFSAQQRQLEKLGNEYREIEQRTADYQAVCEQLEERWISSQAAVLAASLCSGEACPVCGSTEHPEKAAGGQRQISKHELDQARAEWTAMQQKLHMKQAEHKQAELHAEQMEEEVGSADLTINYQEQLERTAEELAQQKENRQSLKAKRAAFIQLEAHCESERNGIEQLVSRCSEVSGQCEAEEAVYQHALLTVPEDVRELPVLEERIAASRSRSAALEKEWETARQQYEECKLQQTRCQSLVQFEEQASEQAQNLFSANSSRFSERLEKEQFDSAEQYERMKLPQEKRQQISGQLQEYDKQHHLVQSAVNELTEALIEKEPQDTARLEQQTAHLKASYEKEFELKNEAAARRQSAQQLHSEMKANQSEQQTLEAAYGKVARLYDVVRGQNRLKISFERFIQIEYLERIIQAANIRLHSLSNGQYELVRSGRQETRGKQSGLGIDVHDAYTGRTRDVKTLSGGEKFNASLCLALGMADAIQSFQGAVRMETMFIDEGFGALDEEAVQKAIDTLIALQQSGRMIGVISHIDEMKEAIPAALEVTKLKEGYSKTKFVFS